MSDKENSRAYFLWGFFLCFLGATFFSTKAIFVKLAYRETDIEAVPLLALRMLFALPFFITSAITSSNRSANVKFTFKQWVAVAIVGCLGYYVSSLLDFIGLQYVTAGIERLILFIYPTFVLLLSAIIFKQRVTSKQWMAVIITYMGLMLAFFSEMDFSIQQNDNFLFGAFMILICALTYGSYIIGSGQLIPLVGATKFNSYAMSFACLGVLLHFYFTTDTSLFGYSDTVYLFALLMALVSTVIPSYLISLGIKNVGSNNAAIIGSVGPVSTILQAYFFLQEPISILQLIGTALILLGVLIIGRKPKNVPG